VVNGTLEMRDQLQEYSGRGEALEHLSFLDFFLNTYEAPYKDAVGSSEQQTAKRGRPRNERVPHLHTSNRKKTGRVLRSAGHETLPQIVGSWFPRNDDNDVHEFYCASMLALLCPWRTLTDIAAGYTTFADKFNNFCSTSTLRTKRILVNAQYYYECTDSATRKKNAPVPTSGNIIEIEPRQFEHDVQTSMELTEEERHLTEHDIDLARDTATSPRERLYGEVAMNIAQEAGIFGRQRPHTVRARPAVRATENDMGQYHNWAQTIKSITRKQGKHILFDSTHEINGEFSYGQHLQNGHGSQTVIPDASKPQQSPSILNTEQRRAHDIISNHFDAHLNGRKPEQLMMFVRGAGGTGKSMLINTLTSTFEQNGGAALLAKTATSGVAASLIKGSTVHSWGCIPIVTPSDNDWTKSPSKEALKKRLANVSPCEYLFIDEISMMTKDLLNSVSQVRRTV
jgi:hypothetical protein